MKLIKHTSLAVLLAGTAFTAHNAAAVEISANAGIASAYLWRGVDLSNGSPAVSADITASQGGAYATVWTSSGDDGLGQEYDLIVGYGGEAGKVSYDVSAVTYIYPGAGNTDFGDLSDVIVSVGYGPATVAHYKNVAGDSGYNYTTISGDIGKVTALAGKHDGGVGDATHIDLSYSYNDNLSFTASKVVDQDGGVDESTHVVASYSVPLK